MTFAAVVRSELADGVADQIRDAILAGEYQPGDALAVGARALPAVRREPHHDPRRARAARAPWPDRAAPGRALPCARLPPHRDRSSCCPTSSGCRATGGTTSEPSALESTNEVLRIIYEGALDLAFERITAAEIAQLDGWRGDVETAAAARDVVAVEHANRSFHQGIARTTHSIALELLVGSFYRVVDSAAARSGDKKGTVGHALDRPRQPGCPAAATRARRRHRRRQARRSTCRRTPDAR